MIDENLRAGLARFLGSLPARPRLLGLGEPMHGEELFLTLRNSVFRWLVEHEGYRVIALETDCLAGIVVDDFVAGGPGSLDEAVARGFSHGFGASTANRELVAWMREHNERVAAADRVRFRGFDGPMEMMYAPSPRGPLRVVHTYLAASLDQAQLPASTEEIDDLTGDDARWTDEGAASDPSRSVGASGDAVALRLLADDLTVRLEAEAPGLIAATSWEAWDRAHLHARTATALLRDHAAIADTSDTRVVRRLRQRDAFMAANLRTFAEQGSTLVFAHNQHLQKVASTWELAGMSLRWWSAGAITAATPGPGYAFLATALGSARARGLDGPPPDTLESLLAPGIHPAAEVRALLRGHAVVPRTDTTTDQGYFPLHPEHLDGADGILFVPEA